MREAERRARRGSRAAGHEGLWRYLILELTGLLLILTLFGCRDFDDIIALSPEELLAKSDIVAEAKLVRKQRITEWGPMQLRGSPNLFHVDEWAFVPQELFKTPISPDTLYLWTYGHSRDSNSSVDDLYVNVGEVRIVYGKMVERPIDLPHIAYPTMCLYRDGHVFTNWDIADSINEADLPRDSTLARVLEIRRRSGAVLGGSDYDLSTLFLYGWGELVYYDSDNERHSVTPDKYIELLRGAAHR